MSSFCDPNKIKVDPNRFRILKITDERIDRLATSIKEVGQLHPILVDKDMNLRAGHCRLMACKKLGRDVWFTTEEEGRIILDNPLLKRVAEYQENFVRSDFTQEEHNKAIAEIDLLMREVYGSKEAHRGISDGTWTQTDTAKKLGYKSHRTVSDAVLITKAIEKGVPGVAEAKTTSEAMAIVKKRLRLEAAEELAKRRSAIETDTEIQDPMKYFGDRIILGDCLEHMKKLPASICNLFVTDPPWKIEMDKVTEEMSATYKACGSYDDSGDDIIPVLKEVIKEMHRIAKPDCSVMMFCGVKHWSDLAEHFRSVGFQVYNKPLVWVKTNPGGGLCSSRSPVPTIWPASVTDFMLMARKGNPSLAQLHKGDAFLHPPVTSADRCHQAQKPLPLMEEIISRFYYPGSNPLLIDPFAGSGSTLSAARRVGITQYFGYELSAENRERAIVNMVNQYMKEQEGSELSTTIDLDEFE